MRFDLVRPCPKCPFRTDIPGFLRGGRAQEIALALAGGASFACHQTTVEVEDPEEIGEDRAEGPNSRMCAGAMIVLEREEQPNQLMRIAERLGEYDRERLDMDAPVAAGLTQFVDHHQQNESDDAPEPCSVVEAGCLAPAGYLEGGLAIRNVEIDPEDVQECPGCGQPVCVACAEESGYCPGCKEDR